MRIIQIHYGSDDDGENRNHSKCVLKSFAEIAHTAVFKHLSCKGLNEKQLFHSHRLIKVILYLTLSVSGSAIVVLSPDNWQLSIAETPGKLEGILSKS